MSSLEASYDLNPYLALPCTESRIDRLEGIGRLKGMAPADARTARVLELGCGQGGNLLPLGYGFAKATFLGIDLSGQQILEAQKVGRHLALENVTFRHQDVCELGPDEGHFDYIIAHGLFSWVPEPVRKRILELLPQLLSPDGIAFVSYNVIPGWHLHNWTREIMTFAAHGLTGMARLDAARSFMEGLAKSPRLPDVARQMLASAQKDLADKEASYLLHDHLAEHNQPFRFDEFHALIAEAGLCYLGDAESNHLVQEQMPTMAGFERPSETVYQEQLSDMLRNRSFRMSLLCRKDAQPSDLPHLENLQELWLRSYLQERPDLKPPSGFVMFETVDQKVQIGVPQGRICQALQRLQLVFPGSAPFSEFQQSTPAPLAGELLELWKFGYLDVLPRAEHYPIVSTEHPLASPIAQWGASMSQQITRLDHGRVTIPAPIRHLLGLMDGRRNLEDLAKEGVRLGYLDSAAPLQEVARFVDWCQKRLLLVSSEPVR